MAAFERQVKKLDTARSGYIDLLWPGTLIVEHKSAGYDLDRAVGQAGEYLASLPEPELPRYLLACDFGRFLLVDLEKRTESRFALSDLPDRVGEFAFMAGRGVPAQSAAERPVDMRASAMMGDIFTMLSRQGYGSPHVERFLVRLAFCMFAEDTGIFERRIFEAYVRTRTSPDGSDLGPRLVNLFEVLDTPEGGRQGNLDDDLKAFPHIDGDLFAGRIDIPACNAELRRLALRSCEFDWSRVSPVIFGNLFQGVMDPDEKHREGAHYTTEENIMRVIGPLFLDSLRAELDALLAGGRRGSARRKKEIERFQDRLSDLRFLDPACGSGNFLIIAYREIRRLELRAIAALHDAKDKRLDISSLSGVDVGQFYGIEKNEFSARIAEVGMWMTDHLMNRELGDMFGHAYARIPIRKSPHIAVADALEADWGGVLPPERCSYVLGNPPFGGSKVMTAEQRGQIRRIAAAGGAGSGGTLDYVSGWFIKASRYAAGGARIGLVATSSIVQGEQVSQLWPAVLGAGLDIVFAHQQFKWGSDARGRASMSVAIVGMARDAGGEKRRLFYHGDGADALEENPAHISPYLIGSPRPLPLVGRAPSALNGLPAMEMGSKAIDGGHYILDDRQRGDAAVQRTAVRDAPCQASGAQDAGRGRSTAPKGRRPDLAAELHKAAGTGRPAWMRPANWMQDRRPRARGPRRPQQGRGPPPCTTWPHGDRTGRDGMPWPSRRRPAASRPLPAARPWEGTAGWTVRPLRIRRLRKAAARAQRRAGAAFRAAAAARAGPPGRGKGRGGVEEGRGKGPRRGGQIAAAGCESGRIGRARLPYNAPPVARRYVGAGCRLQGVRCELCAVRPRRPRLVQAVHGQGRQGGGQGAARKLQGVRQGVCRRQPLRPLLLGRVPRRRRAPPQPRAPAQVHGRPGKARPDHGANEGRRGGPRGPREGREAAAAAVAGARGPGRRAVRMQAVRAQLCAVRRQQPARLLQAVHGQGRQGGGRDAARKLQGVRQEVFNDQPRRPLLLGRVPRRGPEAQPPGERPQARGRSGEALPGGGPEEGAERRPQGRGGPMTRAAHADRPIRRRTHRPAGPPAL